MKDLLSLAGYCLALGCGVYLTVRGHLPGEVMGVLLGAAVPVTWNKREPS